MDFSVRSDRLELLDHPDIPAEDIQRNMLELGFINQKLGGHNITWKGFESLASAKKEISVCEIGCGGGDNLKVIETKTRKRNQKLSLTGIDINPDCIRFAEKLNWQVETRFYISDYKKVIFRSKPDIIYCSLFCHHFTEDELIEMFGWMHLNSTLGFFINDLERHPLAYYSIRFLTRIFSKSYLVKHDAPLSVLRGFKKNELKKILNKAGVIQFSIRWHWAFRWLVIVRK